MPITQTERHYPQLPEKHADLQEHFNQLHSNIYDLRDELQKMHASSTKSDSNKPSFTGDIQGIRVKAVTDPSSLQNGFTIRYNSASGQFEFGT